MEKQAFPLQKLDPRQRMMRGVIYIVAVLLSGALLVVTWFSTIAAQSVEKVDKESQLILSSYGFDFSINKSSMPFGYFTVGSNNQYKIDVSGEVTSSVINPNVNDKLPEGVNLVLDSIDAPDWNCSTSTSRELNCAYTKQIEIKEEKYIVTLSPILFNVNVSSSIAPTVVNTATLTIMDNITTNNVTSETVAIDSVDLEILKSLTPTQVNEGGEITYTLSVINHGPVTATGTKVIDPLSDYLSFVTYTLDTENYVYTTGEWTIGELEKDLTRTITITASTKSGSNGKLIQNTAEVTSTNRLDWNLDNNQASASLIVGGLNISKKIDVKYIDTYVGIPIEFNIVITNVTAESIGSIYFEDKISDLLDIDDYYFDEGSGNFYPTISNTIKGFIQSIPAGDTSIIKVEVRGNEEILGEKVITNVASITWGSGLNQITKISEPIEFKITEASYLKVTKSCDPETPMHDEPITYTVSIENLGSVDAEDIVITDTLGDFLTLGNIDSTILANAEEVEETDDSFVLKLKDDFYIQPDESISFDFGAEIDYDVPIDTILENTIIVIASNDYAKEAEYTSENEVEVSFADLEIEKSVDLDECERDDILEYMVSIRNNGDHDADNVEIVDELDQFLKLVDLDTETLQSNTVYIEEKDTTKEQHFTITLVDPLEADGQWQDFYFTALVASNVSDGYILGNNVEISTTSRESGFNNNSAYTETLVVEPPTTTLEVEYSVSPAQAEVGEFFEFLLQIQNTGDIDATDIEISDSFPAVVDLKEVDKDEGEVTTNTSLRSYEWTIDTLEPDQVASLLVTVEVNDTATDAEDYTTKAELVWEPDGSTTSNTVTFRVLPSETLPPTGWHSLATAIPVFSIFALTASILFALISLAIFGYYLWARRHKPLYAARYLKIFFAGIFITALIAFSAWFLRSPTQTPSELALQISTKAPTPEQATFSEGSKNTGQKVFKDTSLDISNFQPTPTPETLPDYPIPTPTGDIKPDQSGNLPDTSPINRIAIPTMNLDTVVKFVPFDGKSWAIGGLKQEVAWMGETSWLGLGGNTGFAGHVDLADGSEGPFWNLSTLQEGDTVILYTERNQYTYTVLEQKIVDDYDMSVIDETEDPTITLITCAVWNNELRTYLKRLIVTAELEGVIPLETD